MEFDDINKAFAAKVQTFCQTLTPAWDFADADVKFEPKASKPYMIGAAVMATPYNAAIAAPTIFTRQDGFYQVTLHYPASKNSPGDMREIASDLRRAFFDDAARAVTGTPAIIDVLRMPRIDRLPPDNTHVRCAVTIYFTTESPTS